MDPIRSNHITRRKAITLITVTAAGGVLMPRTVFAQQTGADASPLLGADVCMITPQVTEGPFYFDPQLIRDDVTEGRPGAPVLVRLQVVDGKCQPISQARVDIWHCDASGLYSNYSGQGDDPAHPVSTENETFLRGTQFSDVRGVVAFHSIYPGWYGGRTAHIHFKVFLDETNVLTGQIFFPDALSAFIYRNVPPYSERTAERDTLNDDDWIAQQASRTSFASVKEEERNYLVSLIVGVDPNAEWQARPPGPPPGPAGMPRGGPGDPLEGPMQEGNRSGSLVPGVDGIR